MASLRQRELKYFSDFEFALMKIFSQDNRASMACADQDIDDTTETADTATDIIDTAAGFRMGQSES